MAAFAFLLAERSAMQPIGKSSMRPGSATTDLSFETSMGHVIGAALPSIDAALSRVLKRDGISYRQWIILRTLCELGTTTATELARRFGYGTGSLSRLIDRLVRRDLIQRLRTDGDRRVVVLSPTRHGADLVHSTLPRVTLAWKGILRRFDDSEVHLLASLLQRLEELEGGWPGEDRSKQASER